MSIATKNAERLAVFGGPKAVTRPLNERWPVVTEDARRAVNETLILGRTTSIDFKHDSIMFEKEFSEYIGTQFALATNSGTSALRSAYFAIGLQPGDEVIIPAYTFAASATPLLTLGARPVFCDIDPETLTIDLESAKGKINAKTRAICAVHIWGNPANLSELREICQQNNLRLIEDCSHAHGALHGNKYVGNWGDIACFSLQGQKPVSGGEAGVITTNDPDLYDRMLALGHYGRVTRDQLVPVYRGMDQISLGEKYRPHLLGMILARHDLRRLGVLNRMRSRNYQKLMEAFEDEPAIDGQITRPGDCRGGFLEFVFRLDSTQMGNWTREAFVKACQLEGVPINIDRYSTGAGANQLLNKYSVLGKTDLPKTEAIAGSLVTLPPFTDVDEVYIDCVADAMMKVCKYAREIKDVRRR